MKRLVILVLLVAAGSVMWMTLRRSTTAEPLSAEEARRTQEQLVADADTVRLGQLLVRQCAPVEFPERQRCYEDALVAMATEGQATLALGALAEIARHDRQVEREGHMYTHLIGISSWSEGDDVAERFAACNGLFQSGCYHGVIQSYLTSGDGPDSARVAGLCDTVAGGPEDYWLRFQCVHGVGHGLDMIWNWDLLKALEGCDWLVTGWDRQSCYGGAFMENAVAALPSHAPAELLADRDTAAAGDEHADHGDHGDAGGDEASSRRGHHAVDPSQISFKLTDPDDVLYPCSIVEEKYWQACYHLQGGVILRHKDYDYRKAFEGCETAPERVREYCYLSLGTFASGHFVQNTRRIIRACQEGSERYQPWCYVGAVKNYIDLTARGEDGLPFCAELAPGRNRLACYMAIGEQLGALHPVDPEARERVCRQAPAADVQSCLYGAGRATEPPAGYERLRGG